MYDQRTRLSQQVVQEIKKLFPDKILHTMIPRNVKLGEAPSYGQSIDRYEPQSKGAQAYEQLAKELIDKYERGGA